MLPGAVCIWTDGATVEVAPVARISFGTDHFVIVLTDRRRIPLRADPEMIAHMRSRYDEARFVRLNQTPEILPPCAT